MDGVEPPAGRLRVVSGTGSIPHSCSLADVAFAGWLGLLKALYEATGAAGPWIESDHDG